MALFFLTVNVLSKHPLYIQCYIRSTVLCDAISYFQCQFCLFTWSDQGASDSKVNTMDVGEHARINNICCIQRVSTVTLDRPCWLNFHLVCTDTSRIPIPDGWDAGFNKDAVSSGINNSLSLHTTQHSTWGRSPTAVNSSLPLSLTWSADYGM